MLAVVTASYKRKDIVLEKLKDFKWEDVAAIRARVDAKYGKIPFHITLELPDGTGFSIIFHTSSMEAEAYKKLTDRKKTGRLWLIDN